MANTIKLTKTTPNYRTGTARANVYAMVAAHNGKPVSALQKEYTTNPPSLPQKGKSAGKQEPLSGWLAFFVKQGVITIG